MLRVVGTDDDAAASRGGDPRDPLLYRTGIASARAALRQGVARRHDRDASDADAAAAPADHDLGPGDPAADQGADA